MIVTNHNGVDIEYKEELDRWLFCVNRKRHNETSLTQAKRAIDRLKGQPDFDKLDVLVRSNRPELNTVYGYAEARVTSQAGQWDYWVGFKKGGKGAKRQLRGEQILIDTPENREKIRVGLELKAEFDALQVMVYALEQKIEENAPLDLDGFKDSIKKVTGELTGE